MVFVDDRGYDRAHRAPGSTSTALLDVPERVVLGGCSVDLVDRPEVLGGIAEAVRTRTTVAIASANLDHVHHFGLWGEQRTEFGTGEVPWLTLLDGAPLAVRAKQLTGRVWQRQAGSDLLGPILELAERSGWRVGFLGGTTAMHERLLTTLERSRPRLQVAGCWAPERAELADPVSAALLADDVRRARVDVLVVGLGKPRQELWIEQHGTACGAPVLLAFGASADMLAGAVRRAPRIFRITGTEWVYRLLREPRRLRRRYLEEGPVALTWLARDSYVLVDR